MKPILLIEIAAGLAVRTKHEIDNVDIERIWLVIYFREDQIISPENSVPQPGARRANFYRNKAKRDARKASRNLPGQ